MAGKQTPKITNQHQFEAMVDYMEENRGLACGYVISQDARSSSKLLWETLSSNLNSLGPPLRETAEWKRIKDVTRIIKKAVVGTTLDEIRKKSAEKFGKIDLPNIHLDSDGTEVDDEDYFQTLEANAELIAVFPGEQWMDPTHFVTITTHRDILDDQVDNFGNVNNSIDVERVHLKKLVGQLKNNLCNVSVLSEPDLELLSNMDPNSMTDITGNEFIEQLKEASGRILYEKRQALDAIELLKMYAKYKNENLNFHQTTVAAASTNAETSSPQSLPPTSSSSAAYNQDV